MASQAYGKALQLDKDNAAAQTKLAMIKDVFTGRPKEVQVATASPPASLAPPNNSPAAAPEKASGKMVEKPEENVEKPDAKKLAVAEKPSPEQSAGPDDSDEILQVVNTWAKAWSAKDIDEYLTFYAGSFRPHGAPSRTAWEKSRRERITKPKTIRVAIANPKVSFTDATHAKVSFKQSYHSDAIRSNTVKTLEMVKTGEKWLIQQERVGR
jgi:hypothetical protein